MKNPAQKTFYASEKAEQACVIRWLQLKGIPYVAHMTGVNLHGNFALVNTLKQVGCLQKGVPDLFIPVPITVITSGYMEEVKSVFHGLWIEMKKEKGGIVSKEQLEWMEARARDGYATAVCHGADEAIATVEFYLKGEAWVQVFEHPMEG